MNRLTNEQRLQIIEFYYQNQCSVRNVFRALRPIYGLHNRPSEQTINAIVTKFRTQFTLLTLKVIKLLKNHPLHYKRKATARLFENFLTARNYCLIVNSLLSIVLPSLHLKTVIHAHAVTPPRTLFALTHAPTPKF
uniref:DUF4817 domain-containing protein n=1 Tax=Bactrocera dorsalis TaxID=27457 RepID=A0A034V4W1_BACDO